jgi:hypothetical protein
MGWRKEEEDEDDFLNHCKQDLRRGKAVRRGACAISIARNGNAARPPTHPHALTHPTHPTPAPHTLHTQPSPITHLKHTNSPHIPKPPSSAAPCCTVDGASGPAMLVCVCVIGLAGLRACRCVRYWVGRVKGLSVCVLLGWQG